MGDVANSEVIVNTDVRRAVVKMEVPEWICSTICAGIDIDGLSDGSVIEDSEEMPERDPRDGNQTNPLFQTEEGQHMYTKRYPQDKTIISDKMILNSEEAFKNNQGK